MLSKQELALKAIATALRVGVDPALVCTIIEISSGWNAAMTEYSPSAWLLRTIEETDIGGYERWVAMGTRFGPMQVLGQTAFFFGWKEVEKLEDLDVNLEAGCTILKRLLAEQKGNERNAILLWFGQERKEMARKALAMKPTFDRFVEAAPHEKTDSVSPPDAVSATAVRASGELRRRQLLAANLFGIHRAKHLHPQHQRCGDDAASLEHGNNHGWWCHTDDACGKHDSHLAIPACEFGSRRM